jgi:hypothetical protein
MKISLNIIATNKYTFFLDEICETIDRLFFPNSEVLVIIHTNVEIPIELEKYKRLTFHVNRIEHEEWPFTTLKRFHYFLNCSEIIIQTDYSFYVDADSLFIKELPETILPESGMIGTIHPCLFNGEGTPERNPQSRAYIPYGSGNRYFCGGFFGGKSDDFITMSVINRYNIEEDLSRGIIAIWHDESHINNFFFLNPPNVILDHPFAVAESMTHVQDASGVLFLDKNSRGGHDFFRE